MCSKIVATVRKHRTPSEAFIEDLKSVWRIIKALGRAPFSQQNKRQTYMVRFRLLNFWEYLSSDHVADGYR